MKKVKKIVALLLAMVMTLSLGVAALAADNNGTITITNATVDKEYTIYQIFEANPSADGSQVAYLATEAQRTFYEGQGANVFVFTEVAGSDKYNVSVKEGTSDAQVIAFLQSFVTKNTDGMIQVNADFARVAPIPTDGTKTATTSTVVFSNLPYGYYLVTSTLGSVVTVDSTKPNATIIDKNQGGPDWNDQSKTITAVNGTDVTGTNVQEFSANYGDVISYQVQFDATNYDGEKKISSYEITDTLAAGLTYVTTNGALNVTVKVGEKELAADEYTVSEISNVTDGHRVKITIPWMDSRQNGMETTYTDFKYSSPSIITVTYSATVTDEASIAGTGNKNTAALTYYTLEGNMPEPSTETYESETTIYTFALAINKIDPKGTALPGAVFTLKDAEGNPIPVKAVANEPGVYEYDDTIYTDPATPNYDVVSPENGVIVVKGVKEGTYTITETKAPAGYNLLTAPVTVDAKIADSTTYTTKITIYKDANENVVDQNEATTTETVSAGNVAVSGINVINNSGSELPSTGGMGTTIFYVLGAVLVLGAVVLLITKRRMNAGK